jgi:FemAB-related protein (PEP-CTERM system-associated)
VIPSGAVRVETATAAPTDWDRYAAAHPQGSAYHRSAAVCIGARAFGLPCWFLSARGVDGALCGVLPLVEQSSLLFGRYLSSVPFFTYGGVLASDPAAATALASQAAELGRQRRADHVELRHTLPMPELNLPTRTDKVSMILPLPATEEALAKQLGSKLRSQIRRAEREGPEIAWGGAELLDEFYAVHSRTMHELGTPEQSRHFFGVVWETLADAMSVLVIRLKGRAQAAAVLVSHGRCVEVPWAAATPEAKQASVNMRLYWELLRHCVDRGAESFDFGRSTVDSGTYRFKAQWGAQPLPLHWHYWLPGGGPLPKMNASNPKYARAAELWRRMPLWCANLIGPHLARKLP